MRNFIDRVFDKIEDVFTDVLVIVFVIVSNLLGLGLVLVLGLVGYYYAFQLLAWML